MREAQVKYAKEAALRALAQHGKSSALSALAFHLRRSEETVDHECLKRGQAMNQAGELETTDQVREFINSIQ